ncbi:MAG: flagellar hook-basal body complex protein [Oscillospiraceae bacterium]|nr:flagellar hook-basal body complex protein [Oscillospiraceae bacterium]
MVKSLYSGVSGLKTHQAKMDVIGNNIANVNTTGFKAGVVTFRDIYYQYKINPSAATATLGGVNPAMVGYGVRLNSTNANMTNSGFTQSDWWGDVALDGDGFFQVMDGSGTIFYTRAGKFTVDDYGYLVNAQGYHVLGVTGDSTNQEPSSEIIRIVVPATNNNASSATKRVNGTNVTISVSAPSNYTNMTVTFTEADFPYATYDNGILNIFFNPDEQYNSQDDFEQAIQTALQAGGVTLPDDVSLQFEFETIPDDREAAAAKNRVDSFTVSTQTAEYQLHTTYQDDAGVTKHAYMTFSVNDPTCQDKVKISLVERTDPDDVETATYADGTWTLNIFNDSTASDINAALKKAMDLYDSEGTDYSKLVCDNLVLPSGATQRQTVFADLVADAADGVQLVGGTATGVTLDVQVQEAGAFGNNYKIVFAYKAGYGKTSAIWDENTLTVTISADSTVTDVNKAIKDAANGNPKRLLSFNDISGLDYGDDFPDQKDPENVWQPVFRQAFFGGNPAIRPMDGKDSFFTETAKALGTFALENGRIGSEQSFRDLTDILIQQDGTIIGLHAVHGYLVLGRIDVATFDNVNGLAQVGGTNFRETVASGKPKLNVASTGGAGAIISGALEMSNVDLSQEFTDMITTQRGFQANSRVITVSDTMLEELLSLKR